MRRWSRIAIRNLWARRGRAAGALLAVALGTATVVWVNCCYESVRRSVTAWATSYVGRAHLTISSALGKFDTIPQRLISRIEKVPNVAHVVPRLIQRLECLPVRAGHERNPPLVPPSQTPLFDVHGLDPVLERLVRSYRIVAGRMLRPDDARRSVCVLESGIAERFGVGVGDELIVWSPTLLEPRRLEIVGVFERRRVARFQKPVALVPLRTLQRISGKAALVTSLDVVLETSDRRSLIVAARRIRSVVKRIEPGAVVRSGEARLKQIERAQQQQQYAVADISTVALMSAMFIILSTLSMGTVERIRELGLLRCVGLTRGQLVRLVLAEVMPLGALGVALGVPIGFGMTLLTVRLVPDYVGQFAISRVGVALAAVGGIATTLVAALIPAIGASRVSPLEATRPRSQHATPGPLVGVGLLAVALLAAQRWWLVPHVQRSIWFIYWSSAAVSALYVGYALASPLLVRLVAAPAVRVAGLLLRVRGVLLADQVGHAVWRGAGICCGLMVGLSLLVTILIVNASIVRGWSFPRQFPEAYVWSYEQMRPDADQIVRQVPGVREATVGTAVNVIVEERNPLMAAIQLSITWFLGCDPDTFFDLVRLEFLEGSEAEARELLHKGGWVVVTDDFSRSRNKHKGDTVKVYYQGRIARFRIAAVVRSPALDIAAGYFQLQTEYNVVASGSVMGSRADVARHFGIRGTSVVLLNFDLPEQPPPPDWPPPKGSPQAAGLPKFCWDATLPVERRWRRWREVQVLRELRRRLGASTAFVGTVSELKDRIDAELNRMTRIVTVIPLVALIVAAIGVANLMSANVLSRIRQLAILRAVGATRGLLSRLVIGEALVLGLLGSALGLALGLHVSSDILRLVARMWGMKLAMQLPQGYLAAAIGLSLALCVIAGVMPARYASKTNVVEALRVT